MAILNFIKIKHHNAKGKMAIHLEANYSKKLGLPGYSSHQYCLTIKTEITDSSQVQVESTRLYGLLQSCVDRELQNPGFVPGRGSSNGHDGSNTQAPDDASEAWACSPRQRNLIIRIVADNSLDKTLVEALAQERFGKKVRALNKLEASGLIDELINQAGGTINRWQRSLPRSTHTNQR